MNRVVSALYPGRSAAEAVRQELTALGLPDRAVRVVPEAGPGGRDLDVDPDTALEGLDLPDDDRRRYAEHIRGGDVLVSTETPEDRVEAVEAIMRRPSDAVAAGAVEPGLGAPTRGAAPLAPGRAPGDEGPLRHDQPSVLPEAGAFGTGRRLD